jgi:hypothetical protein
MISSLITNSIAPAAMPSTMGIAGSAIDTSAAPKAPPTGSTRPVRVATQNAEFFE